MANLSITRAWNESMEFLRRESRLVLPVAFLLISLPGALLQYLMPATAPGQPPNLQAMIEGLKTVMLLLPVVLVLSLIGTIAITYLAIKPGRSVGEALQAAGRRFLLLLGASVLLGLGLVATMIPLFLLFGAYAPGMPPAGLIALAVLAYLILIVALMVRLLLVTPVASGEEAGPIAIITRSWALTAGHFWKLLGFLIVFWITALIVLMVISIILGILIALIAGLPAPGTFPAFLMLLCSAALQAVLTSVYATVAARIYVQLAGDGAAQGEVFA